MINDKALIEGKFESVDAKRITGLSPIV